MSDYENNWNKNLVSSLKSTWRHLFILDKYQIQVHSREIIETRKWGGSVYEIDREVVYDWESMEM